MTASTLLVHLAAHHRALMTYDDGTHWRINRFGLVQGRTCVNADVVRGLVAGGKVVWVACQVGSGNEIWRAVEEV